MTKKFGFTLAEVLITLGIIGVVAAMTMPTLINQTNGAQYKAAYKKALSAISQAVTLNVALDDASFADTVANTAGSTDKPSDGDYSVASLLNTRMNVVNKATSLDYTIDGTTLPTSKTVDTYLYFNDGSMFAFANNQAGTTCTMTSDTAENNVGCAGYIDVNGAKGPNKVVQCDPTTNGTAVATAFDTYAAGVKTAATACAVTSPTDVYPVFYYDQTVVPATNAAAAVLYGK